jgi:hypothetical protein
MNNDNRLPTSSSRLSLENKNAAQTDIHQTTTQPDPAPMICIPSGQLDRLISTNEALHCVVIRLEALLSDPSRSISYTPKKNENWNSQQNVISDDEMGLDRKPEGAEGQRWIPMEEIIGDGIVNAIVRAKGRKAFEDGCARVRDAYWSRKKSEIEVARKGFYKCE